MAKRNNSVNKARFIRNFILQTGAISPPEVQQAWEAAGHDPDAITAQDVYTNVSNLKRRYGVELDYLPRKNDGTINVTKLIRMVKAAHPDYTPEQIVKFLGTDNLTTNPSYVRNAVEGINEEEEGALPPRARYTPKRGVAAARKKGKGQVTVEDLKGARSFVEQAGSVDRARQILEELQQLQT